MRCKIRFLIVLALVVAIGFVSYELNNYKNLSAELLSENIRLKSDTKNPTINHTDSSKQVFDKTISSFEKIKKLEKENKILKAKLLELEKKRFIFESNKKDNIKYDLDENLKFKDVAKDIKLKKENPEQTQKDEYTITPSIDFNKEKKEIEGVKLKVQTTF